jgi:hypothetical protein
MKRAVILFIFSLLLLFVNLASVSAAQCSSGNITTSCECSGVTYNSGSGFCCDTGNSDGGVFFRGDYYNSCPSGTFRYFSNSGNDGNLGTFSSPWGTIAKANTIGSGEVAIFLGGTYNEYTGNPADPNGLGANLVPSSGSPGNPTIYKGHPDYNTKITAQNIPAATNPWVCTEYKCLHRAVNLWGKAYVILDNLEVTESFDPAIWGEGSSNIIIQNCSVHDVVGGFSSVNENAAGIAFYYGGSDHITIRGCSIHDIFVENRDGVYNPTKASAIEFYRTDTILVENNVMYNVNNAVHLKQHDGNGIFRRNKIYNIGDKAFSHGPGVFSSTSPKPWNNTFYENTIYNVGQMAFFVVAYNAGDFYGPNNTRIFNNAVHTVNRAGVWLNTWDDKITSPAGRIDNPYIVNNILYNTDIGWTGEFAGENFLYMHTYNIFNLTVDYNILYDDADTDVVYKCDSYGSGSCGDAGSPYFTLAQHQIAHNKNLNSLSANPQFLSTNPSSPNFLRPAPGSPAIDNGTIVPGYHCTTSGGTTPAGCKVWYGLAPDIGAYEYNPGLPTITCTTVDVNDDLKINIIDLSLVTYWQGKNSVQPDWNNYKHLDVNSDNSTNFGDVNEVLTRVGQSC